MPKTDRYTKYFDEAWKKVIEKFFPQLIRFFVPEMHIDIDFSKGVSFLDKEMERLSKRSQKGAKYVDKLAKVYLKDEIIGLFEFVDWALELGVEEDEKLWEKLEEIERGENMPYITSVERIGLKKGFEQGALEKSREMVLEALEVKFGEIPQEITKLINSLDDVNKLNLLHRHAIKCASLDEFKKLLDEK